MAHCRVIVYSPPYGGTHAPDVVEVKWDNVTVFSGTLPERRSGPDGMPITLLDIHTTAGSHVLEVIHGRDVKTVKVQLQENDEHHFHIFGLEGGKEVLVEDLGKNPKFQ